MFFSDLSPYFYDLPRPLTNVLNVGWLDSAHPYTTGNVPPDFLERLKWCIQFCTVNQLRGFHECSFCPVTQTRHSITVGRHQMWLGSDEIWIPAPGNKVFAAPTLIFHYVAEHNYQPPEEFIDSMRNPLLFQSWCAGDEFERRAAEIFGYEIA